MTVLVSVKINDGVVMAADSASSFASERVGRGHTPRRDSTMSAAALIRLHNPDHRITSRSHQGAGDRIPS